jgi:hypothetical protein
MFPCSSVLSRDVGSCKRKTYRPCSRRGDQDEECQSTVRLLADNACM